MKRISPTVILLPLLAAACGDGAGADYGHAYATLHGSITSSSVQTTSDVRVALVWQQVGGQTDAAALRSVQELGLRAQFPATFQMEINALPPGEALSHMDPGAAAKAGIDPNLHLATGTLVVYEDTNGNGKLDLLSVDARSAIDRVLGVPQGLTLLYVEGTPPAPASHGYFAGLGLQRGFNLLQEPGWQSGVKLTASTTWTLLPLSTDIPIVLTAAPQLSRYVCQKNPGLIDECAMSRPSDPSVPTATLSPNCDLSLPAPDGPTPGSTGTTTQPPSTGDKPPLGAKPPPGSDNGSNGTNGAGGATASPPGTTQPPSTGDKPPLGAKPPPGSDNGSNGTNGTNGAAPVNCGPDTAAAPCSQSACMFNPEQTTSSSRTGKM